MDKTQLLELLRTFTREDWKEFDSIRAKAFEPTKEEMQEKEQVRLIEERALFEAKLAKLGLTKDTPITKELVKNILEQMQAKQFIGENIDEWIDAQMVLFGGLDIAFKKFIMKYID